MELDERLPKFKETLPSHKKKNADDLQIGQYSDQDLDVWAELIKAKVCTYEGISRVYNVSVGSLHKRLDFVPNVKCLMHSMHSSFM